MSHCKMDFPEAACSFGTHHIESPPTSSSDDGIKVHLVYKEVEKKLEEEGEQFVKKSGDVLPSKVNNGPGVQKPPGWWM